MGKHKIKIGILTSSRADYGIYLPLLKLLKKSKEFNLELIVFGTHLKKKFGYTLNEILKDGFSVKHRINNLIVGDSPYNISLSYSNTCRLFSKFWQENYNKFDLVFALGDRFEMAAAVNSSIPFQIKIAHLYGGDVTLGAIDNIYRDQITLASKIHFVALEAHKNRIMQITNNINSKCYVIGAMSLDNLKDIKLFSIKEFKEIWNIDLSIPTILVTIHPETIHYQKNKFFAKQTYLFLKELSKKFQIVITMPNADTEGDEYRVVYEKLLKKDKGNKIKLIENFGVKSYFTCMKYCSLLIGNTSSGIIEAASFNKFVINIGERQKGRFASENVFNVKFDSNDIINCVNNLKEFEYKGENIYYKGGASEIIVNKLLEISLDKL